MVEVLTVDLRKSTGEQTKQTNKNHVMNQGFIKIRCTQPSLMFVSPPPRFLLAKKSWKRKKNIKKRWVEAFLRHLWHGHGHPMHLWHALGEEMVEKQYQSREEI